MLTQPRPNGEDYRPGRWTESVWSEGEGTDEPMARGIQISLGRPFGTITTHLVVPGEDYDQQAQGETARRDQTQPPPEMDNDLP